MSMLDLRRMMLLCDLADLGTVSAVAERRNITSSAVSQQLRVLENEAGAVLYRREGRTLALTRSGRVLADHVRVVLDAVDDAMSALAATRDHVSGQVAIASYNMAVPSFVAPLMQRLKTNESELQVHLQQTEPDDAIRLLRQSEVDVAITYRCDFEADGSLGGLSVEPLLDEPLVLLAPEELHHRIRLSGVSVLAQVPWATAWSGSILDIAVERAAERAGFTPRISHRLSTAQVICDVAATGAAAAIVPRLAVPNDVEHLIVPSAAVGHRRVNAVVRTGRQRDPNVQLIVRTLKAIGFEAKAGGTAWEAAS